jgi:hypothetical protein
MTGLRTLIDRVGVIVSDLILLMAGVALLAFFYGLAKFIFKAGDEKGIEEGKNIMLWGLVALFVLVSVWGIIAFFQRDLGIFDGGIIQLRPL